MVFILRWEIVHPHVTAFDLFLTCLFFSEICQEIYHYFQIEYFITNLVIFST